MRERNALTLSETYGARLKAFELLRSAGGARGGDTTALRSTAGELDGSAASAADSEIGSALSAFADLIRIAADLVDWRESILIAAMDADRFKRAALAQLILWRAEHQARRSTAYLSSAFSNVDDGLTTTDVSGVCQRLAGAPLPVRIYSANRMRRGLRIPPADSLEQEQEPPPTLNVAFLSFTVDGDPADQLHYLAPSEAHDLAIEVRVSRWPEGVAELRVSPVSIENRDIYHFPEFKFSRPDGDPPFTLRERGLAIVKVPQALRAQPLEFRYAAEFWPKESEQPVSVVGHRTLRIESIDLRRNRVTGYPAMDRHIMALRNELRRRPAMPREDLETAMILATATATIAARAVQDNLFPEPVSELDFQRFMRDYLRERPEIGGDMDEHPHTGGGITDLSLRGVRFELKVGSTRRMTLADCQQFVEQAAAYAVGSGKRIGLLSVLDVSRKGAAPFPAEDGVGVLVARSGLPILTILIQGHLATPSSLSRRRTTVG